MSKTTSEGRHSRVPMLVTTIGRLPSSRLHRPHLAQIESQTQELGLRQDVLQMSVLRIRAEITSITVTVTMMMIITAQVSAY